MAYLEKSEIHDAYKAASDEADIWRENYPEYERLADNGLMEGLDENLPEVNDGSLAASLFKLAKRVIKKKITGRAIALDSEDVWKSELANIQWEKNILKNANSMATPRRKWKDAARKAAIYGGQPIITLFVENGNYTGADFIVPYAQDVKLEAGKASDMDSDIIFWDVYYTKLQVKNMLEQAEEEMQQAKDNPEQSGYNKWNIAALKEIIEAGAEEDRPGNEEHNEKMDKGVKKSGIHFYIAFQRGVDAPFTMHHKKFKDEPIREWSNPDPTGDVPVHYLYFYQDFINPYGIGVVKLAGGTQNVLDYMRQADILATQIGIRPPKMIRGDINDLDEDSMIYAQDANWYVGNAEVQRMEISNQVYQQMPGRISMYKTSLNQMIPTGDTSIGAEDSGDPNYSKTPAGVKFQAAALSVDDDDLAENVDETWALVARSMINTHFANMQGTDLMKLDADEREVLARSGIDFPVDPETGEPTSELEILWDEARATFDFEVDPDADKTTDEEQALEGKLRAYELMMGDPMLDQTLQMSGKRLNRGELLADIFSQLTDNDKIIEDIAPEEMEAMQQEQMMAGQAPMLPEEGQPVEGEVMPPEMEQPADPERDEFESNLMAVMEQYEVDENTATAMLAAEREGFSPEEITEALKRNNQPQEPANV